MTEPKRCDVCGEVHAPGNPIPRTREANEGHGLIWVDPRTAQWGDGILSAEEVHRRALGADGDGTWVDLTQRLGTVLGKMRAGEYLILNVTDAGDGSGENPGYYVQFACYGEKGFVGEAVSNVFLDERWKLRPEEMDRLLGLGWSPSPHLGEGNYRRRCSGPTPVADIAQLAVSTLRRVYGVTSKDQLGYRAFAKVGGEIDFPALGLRQNQPMPRTFFTATEPAAVREEFDREPRTVTGELVTRYVPTLSFTQYFIGGVQVDPATIRRVDAASDA